jgi:di/tripeptidase
MSKIQLLSQYQLLLNQMFIENFKALRIQQKKTEKKRKLVGQKAKKIHEILVQVAKEPDDEEEPPKKEVQIEPSNEIPELIQPSPNDRDVNVNLNDVPMGPPYNRVSSFSRRNNLKDLMPV